MKLLLKTSISDENWDLGLDFAFLDLSPAEAQQILRRKASRDALAESDMDVSEIHYHDCGPVYFPRQSEGLIGDACERLDIVLQDTCDTWVEVPELAAEDFENIADRSECDRLVIGRDGFHFECYPKHCDPVVETREVPYAVVQKAAMEDPEIPSSESSHRAGQIWDGKFVAGGTFERGE